MRFGARVPGWQADRAYIEPNGKAHGMSKALAYAACTGMPNGEGRGQRRQWAGREVGRRPGQVVGGLPTVVRGQVGGAAVQGQRRQWAGPR